MISGFNLGGASAVTFSGTGVTATVLDAGNPPLRALIVIAPDAVPGDRTITVTTANGVSEPYSGFTIGAESSVRVTSISPAAAGRGATLSAVIAGRNLYGATAINIAGTGVTASITGPGTDSYIPVTLNVAADASMGVRAITVTTPLGTSDSFSGIRVNLQVRANRITTVTAGVSVSGFTVDGAGNIYFADESNDVIRKVTPSGSISIVVGTGEPGFSGDGGPATSAQLFRPVDVAADGTGYLYIADYGNRRIRKVTPSGTIVTIAGGIGTGGDGSSALGNDIGIPGSLVIDTAGNLFFSDGNRVRKINTRGILSTVAGTGIYTGLSTGDGGLATSATFRSLGKIAMDEAGNIYVADANRVRQINAAGFINTIAGDDNGAFYGESDPAILAEFNRPSGLVVDSNGSLIIGDSGNNRVRLIGSDTLITTIAGTGALGFSGDGGPATSATLASPAALAIDGGGNLLLADYSNNRVRRIAATTSTTLPMVTGVSPFYSKRGTSFSATITGTNLSGVTAVTFSGTGLTASISQGATSTSIALTITVDASAPLGPHVVALTKSNGDFTTFRSFTVVAPPVNGGIFPLSGPQGFSIQTMVVGLGLTGVTAVNISGTGVTAAVLTGAVDSAAPILIAIDADAAPGPRQISLITDSGTLPNFADFTVTAEAAPSIVTTIAGTGEYVVGLNNSAQLNSPSDVVADRSGNVYVADSLNSKVRKIDPAGVMTTIAGTQFGNGGDGGPATSAQIGFVYGLTLDQSGNLYVGDHSNSRVRKINSQGIITTIAGGGAGEFSGDGGLANVAAIGKPIGLAFDATGNLFIASLTENRVRKINPAGIITTFAGTGTSGFGGDGGPATSATFSSLGKVAADAGGNIFIADVQNNRIRKITPGGTITTVVGGGNPQDAGDGGPAILSKLFNPTGVAFDSVGNLFVADTGNNTVRKVTLDGIIRTIAGTGNAGMGNNNVPATSSSLHVPTGIAVDSLDNLLIADTLNYRIRKVTFQPTITNMTSLVGVQGTVFSAQIIGTGLLGVTSVIFRTPGITAVIGNGGTATTLPVTISIAGNAPQGATTLIVARSDGTSGAFGGFAVISPIPNITNISPAIGAAGSTIAATIAGINLTGTPAVVFSGTGVIAAINEGGTSTSLPITITIATDASPGVRTASITTSGGTSSPFTGFTVLPAGSPILTDLSQIIAPFYGGPFVLTLNGQGFESDAAVSIGALRLTTTFINSTQLTAVVTTSALGLTGVQNVTVANPGNLVSNALPLKVVVHGDLNQTNTVNIGDAVVSALTSGGVIRPPLALTVGDLNLSGTANISDALTVALFAGRVVPDWAAPSITSISPPIANPGDVINISGSGFSTIAAANQVLFTTGTSVVRVTPSASSTTNLTVIVPNNAISGIVQPYRTDVPLGGLEFPDAVAGTNASLVLTRVRPYFRVQTGSTVTLEGMGFDSVAENNTVTFSSMSGNIGAAVLSATTTSLVVVVPTQAACGPVRVAVNGRTSNARVATITGASCSLQLTDILGGGSPGDTLVLEGVGFDVSTPANNVVRFATGSGNTVIAPVLAAGSTLLQVHVPETAVSGDVTVTVGNAVSNAVPYQNASRP